MIKATHFQYLTEGEAAILERWNLSMNKSRDELAVRGIPIAPSGQRARLCRAGSLPEIAMTDGFRALWVAIQPDIQELDDTEDLPTTSSSYLDSDFAILAWACIAGVIADVRTDDRQARSIASLAGARVKGSDRSVLSELRFQQLQTVTSEEELMLRLRRIVKHLGRQAPVARLADDILCWFAEYHERIPREVEKRIALKWASEYYAAASAKPTK